MRPWRPPGCTSCAVRRRIPKDRSVLEGRGVMETPEGFEVSYGIRKKAPGVLYHGQEMDWERRERRGARAVDGNLHTRLQPMAVLGVLRTRKGRRGGGRAGEARRAMHLVHGRQALPAGRGEGRSGGSRRGTRQIQTKCPRRGGAGCIVGPPGGGREGMPLGGGTFVTALPHRRFSGAHHGKGTPKGRSGERIVARPPSGVTYDPSRTLPREEEGGCLGGEDCKGSDEP